MNVLFIRPNSKMTGTPPPIGLGYLSHAVKKARGDQTLIIEGLKSGLSEAAILERTAAFNPDVIGITIKSFEASQATSLVSLLKDTWRNISVILGGPHVTTVGPSLLDTVRADYLVLGEGEDTLVELLDSMEGKRDINSVKGVAWRNGDKIVFNGSRPYIEDLDRLEVDWEAIGPENYFGRIHREGFSVIPSSHRRVPIFTSRGCPYGCTYCHNIFGKKYRTFDTGRIIDQMIDLRDQYNVREFEIHDDNFNLNINRAKGFMKEVIEKKLGCALSFPNGLRADLMDEELLDLMVMAGTYYIFYAIESASPRIQKLVNKNLDLDRAKEIVNLTASRRIVTGTYNILGFPTETEEEMAMTVNYVTSLKHHFASFFYLTPFPGTEIAEADPHISVKVREIGFDMYTGLKINLSSVPDEVLMKMRRTAYRKFYFSPVRAARILRDVPKNPFLPLSALAVLRLSFQDYVHH